MKHIINRLLSIALLFVLSFSTVSSLSATGLNSYAYQSENSDLLNKLLSLNGVSDVKSLESKAFKEKFVLNIEQPINHKNPSQGTFKQRVFVMLTDVNKPTVLVTEGYGGAYAERPNYREELSRIFDANIVFVEHRYFLNSTPQPLDWTYLTAENAANDLHRINVEMRKIFKGKWIATGISKGGQNAMLYTMFFPGDMDVTVPYVAPLCKGVEDGRHEPFLNDFAGTQVERQKIKDFQTELLKRRSTLQPMFNKLCADKGYEFNLPIEEIYDYTVLEFSFSLWQWGAPVSDIPALNADDQTLFAYWIKMCSPDYFVKESNTSSFFVQAAKELGYYGYDIKPFKQYLKIKSAKGYLNKIFLPQGLNVKFDRSLYKNMKMFLDKTNNKMMFIYGEFDPWSAVMVDEPKGKNIVVFVEPKGSHRTRIGSLKEDDRNKAVEILTNWLK